MDADTSTEPARSAREVLRVHPRDRRSTLAAMANPRYDRDHGANANRSNPTASTLMPLRRRIEPWLIGNDLLNELRAQAELPSLTIDEHLALLDNNYGPIDDDDREPVRKIIARIAKEPRRSRDRYRIIGAGGPPYMTTPEINDLRVFQGLHPLTIDEHLAAIECRFGPYPAGPHGILRANFRAMLSGYFDRVLRN